VAWSFVTVGSCWVASVAEVFVREYSFRCMLSPQDVSLFSCRFLSVGDSSSQFFGSSSPSVSRRVPRVSDWVFTSTETADAGAVDKVVGLSVGLEFSTMGSMQAAF